MHACFVSIGLFLVFFVVEDGKKDRLLAVVFTV